LPIGISEGCFRVKIFSIFVKRFFDMTLDREGRLVLQYLTKRLIKMKQKDTREKILRAAEEVFAKDGFAGARIQQISQKAGINQAMIYYYFSSKENLYQMVLTEAFFRLNQVLSRALSENLDFAHNFRRFIGLYFDLVSQNRNFTQIIQQELANGGKHARQIAPQYIRPLYLMGRKLIEEGIASGECRPLDIDSLLLTIFTLTTFYFAASSIVSFARDTNTLEPEMTEKRTKEVIELILKGIRKDRG